MPCDESDYVESVFFLYMTELNDSHLLRYVMRGGKGLYHTSPRLSFEELAATNSSQESHSKVETVSHSTEVSGSGV